MDSFFRHKVTGKTKQTTFKMITITSDLKGVPFCKIIAKICHKGFQKSPPIHNKWSLGRSRADLLSCRTRCLRGRRINDCLRRASPPHPRRPSHGRHDIWKRRYRQEAADLANVGGESVRVESERLAETIWKL